ncbi:MAG: hypothetical protein CM1200mP2_35910 [Planctomycetaceae bacterium]|nr:MAG: hypothetical protein CM1200mP2_35910 [Planctomycetaceae bacterium]
MQVPPPAWPRPVQHRPALRPRRPVVPASAGPAAAGMRVARFLSRGVAAQVEQPAAAGRLAHPSLAGAHPQPRGHFQAPQCRAAGRDRSVDLGPGISSQRHTTVDCRPTGKVPVGGFPFRPGPTESSQCAIVRGRVRPIVRPPREKTPSLRQLPARPVGRPTRRRWLRPRRLRPPRSTPRHTGLAPRVGQGDPATGQVGGSQFQPASWARSIRGTKP